MELSRTIILPVVMHFLLLFASIANGKRQDGQKLVCYSELWAKKRPSPGNYNLDYLPDNTCDYLVLMYLTLDRNNFALRLHDGYGDVDPEEIHKAAKARSRNPGMKVLLAVGGWEDGVAKYSDMISEEPRRRQFVESVVKTLDTYNLDGLELHWLFPGVVWRGGKRGDKENFVQLVQDLKTAFKQRKWLLTASVPPDETTIRDGYNVQRLNSLLHQFHVRTIDMRGEWNGVASGHSPLFTNHWEDPKLQQLNVNGSLSLWVREGASPRKLLPTFPFYGRTFTLRDHSKTEPGSPVDGPGRGTPALSYAPGIMAYFEICDGLQNKRLSEYFQSGAETPYAVQDDLWAGYEDEKSLERKVKFVKEMRLGGAAVYAIGMDDFRGRCGQSNFLLRKMREFSDTDVFFPDPRKG